MFQLTGSYRPALISLMVFFIVGALLLSQVRAAEGVRAAGNVVPSETLNGWRFCHPVAPNASSVGRCPVFFTTRARQPWNAEDRECVGQLEGSAPCGPS